MATIETELAIVKAIHLRLAKIATHFEADANRACTDWWDAQARLVRAEQEAKLAREDLDNGREQSTRLAKAAEEPFRQVMWEWTEAQSFEADAKCFKSQMSEVDKVRDDATSTAIEKGRQAWMLGS